MATVLSCRYVARTGRALAFGLLASKHFLVRYNYWVDGALLEDEFFGAKPIPQGSVFPVRYDPALPGRNQHTSRSSQRRTTLLALLFTACLLFSLVWIGLLHGCQ